MGAAVQIGLRGDRARVRRLAGQIAAALLVAQAAQQIWRVNKLAGVVLWCLAVAFVGIRLHALGTPRERRCGVCVCGLAPEVSSASVGSVTTPTPTSHGPNRSRMGWTSPRLSSDGASLPAHSPLG